MPNWRPPSTLITLWQQNLAATHRQKRLWELWDPGGNQRMKNAIRRKQAHTHVLGPPAMVLVPDPKIALSPYGHGYRLIWHWFCQQHHLRRGMAGAMPAHSLGNRPAEFTPGCGP